MSGSIHRLSLRVAALLAAITLIAAVGGGYAQAQPKGPPASSKTCSVGGKTYQPGQVVEVTVKSKSGTHKFEAVCTEDGTWRKVEALSVHPARHHVTVTTAKLQAAAPELSRRAL